MKESPNRELLKLLINLPNNGSDMSVVENKLVGQPQRVTKTATNVENKQPFTEKAEPQCRNKRNSVDLENVCRICLQFADSMISLMTKIGKDVLANIYYTITSVEVVPEENLPMSVCIICHDNMLSYYRFKIKCIESYNLLHSKIDIDHGEIIKHCRITGKIDDEIKTCIAGNNIELDEFEKEKPVTSKIDSELKREPEDNEEVEYLEEDLPLIDKLLTNTGDVINNGLLIEKKYNENSKRLYFSCPVCSQNFLKLQTLRAHSKACHKNTKNEYNCGQCKHLFNSAYDLKIHSVIHSKGNKWKCLECKKEFTDRSRFRRHIRRHMDTTKRWTCSTCGKAFTERCALRRHARVHTGEAKEKKYACTLCDKKFADGNQLKEHSAKHTGVRPCACEVCGKTFASSRLLASHRRVHSDHRPYKCAHCDRRFREKSTLNTHTRTHTGERPYVCSVCGKAFIQSSNLSLHMRTHTGEKPYTCAVCERNFSAGSTLACHMRTHTGEKPYCCPYCGKRFARTDIKAHVRLHTGERPYACQACPKAFVSASALRDHHRAHTGEKPFQCALCPEKFKKKVYLTNHLKVHAKKENTKEKEEIVIKDQQVPYLINVYTKDVELSECQGVTKNVTLNADEIPLQVSEELILQDDSDIKSELLIFDDDQNNINCQNNRDVCLNEVIVGSDLSINNVNVIAQSEGEVNLSEPDCEGTTVKLYQLDESLLQIQAAGSQVTIRKISSKMTTNF